MTNPEQCWYLERIGEVDEVNYVLNNTKELIRVGRNPRWNDKVCKCRHVSQKHLELVRQGSLENWRRIRWSVKNLSVTNGTYINRAKISSSQLLEHNDILGLGNPRDKSIQADTSAPSTYTFVYRVKAPIALTNEQGLFEYKMEVDSDEQDTDVDMDPDHKTSRSPTPPPSSLLDTDADMEPTGKTIKVEKSEETTGSTMKVKQDQSGGVVETVLATNDNESQQKGDKSDKETEEDDVSSSDSGEADSDGTSNNTCDGSVEDDESSDQEGDDYAHSEENVEHEEEETVATTEESETEIHVNMDKATDSKLIVTPIKIKKLIDKKTVAREFAKDPVSDTFLWEKSRQEGENILLDGDDFCAAPVSTFHHAPLADSCENSVVGIEVGVSQLDDEDTVRKAYIIRTEGYMALLKYLDNEDQFWLNIMSRQIQYPTSFLENCDLEKTHMLQPKVQRKPKYKVGSKVEVLDRSKLGQMKIAKVTKITGNRLHLFYDVPGTNSVAFFCNEDSTFLHEIGWSKAVGHMIYASKDYFKQTQSKTNDLRETLEPTTGWEVGMKLEVVDPIKPKNICPATVKKVLKGGFIYVRIDSSENSPAEDCWFCYPTNSQHIFPPGFCDQYNITLAIDKQLVYNDKFPFTWLDYLERYKAKPAPDELFRHRGKNDMHAFKVGMKVECADWIEPNLICPATIIRVAGRLLKVHFDGWPKKYNQWMDCRSEDLYPVGWAQVVGHQLQAPYGWIEAPEEPVPSTSEQARTQAKKRKKEGHTAKSAKRRNSRN